MTITLIFTNKELKPKEKVAQLAQSILQNTISIDELIEYMQQAKDPIKGSCIEALEYVTLQRSNALNTETFLFIKDCLAEKAPRIKWESAKVIANTAQHFPEYITDTITQLLLNAKHEGTVVRWSVAYAIKNILQTAKEQKEHWRETIIQIINEEEKNSIKKLYQEALNV